MISFNVTKEEKIALSIFFKDLTLDTVLNGLRILKVLKPLKLEDF